VIANTQAAKVVSFFRVHLRKPLVASLLEMNRLSSPELSLELFISQLVESSVAEFRRVRLPDEKNIPSGAPTVADPEKRGGKGHPMFNAAECERVRRLAIEHGLNAKQIAGRFGGKLSVQVIRRILWKGTEE
jgi:hypothetical protein